MSLSSQNQPSTAEDPGEEEYPSTRNTGNSTHPSLPISCSWLSLRTAGKQQWPFPSRFVLSCSPPLSVFQSS